MAENEDPEQMLGEIKKAGSEVIAASKHLTVALFANNTLAYAAIGRLPPSYGLLASTFQTYDKCLTLSTVMDRVAIEHQ